MTYKGIPLVIEYKKGEFKPDKNSSVSDQGWYLWADYGYIPGTKSQEPGEELDVFVGEFDSDSVYLATFTDPSERLTEVKVLLGFISAEDAANFIRAQYYFSDPFIVTMSVGDFKVDLEQGKLAALKDKEWVKVAPQAQPGKTDIEVEKSLKGARLGLVVILGGVEH